VGTRCLRGSWTWWRLIWAMPSTSRGSGRYGGNYGKQVLQRKLRVDRHVHATPSMATFHLTRLAFQSFHRSTLRSPISIPLRAMSFQASVSKLQPPVKDLVLSATRDGKDLVGQTEADEKAVIGWIDKTSEGNLVTENNLKVCCLDECMRLVVLTVFRIWILS
jgi:hypothetical protein